jgi:hypothetical protein
MKKIKNTSLASSLLIEMGQEAKGGEKKGESSIVREVATQSNINKPWR